MWLVFLLIVSFAPFCYTISHPYNSDTLLVGTWWILGKWMTVPCQLLPSLNVSAGTKSVTWLETVNIAQLSHWRHCHSFYKHNLKHHWSSFPWNQVPLSQIFYFYFPGHFHLCYSYTFLRKWKFKQHTATEYDGVVGWIMATERFQALNPGIYKCYIKIWKKDFADVITLRILRRGDNPGLSGWAQKPS